MCSRTLKLLLVLLYVWISRYVDNTSKFSTFTRETEKLIVLLWFFTHKFRCRTSNRSGHIFHLENNGARSCTLLDISPI
jgi:hypothetical protein